MVGEVLVQALRLGAGEIERREPPSVLLVRGERGSRKRHGYQRGDSGQSHAEPPWQVHHGRLHPFPPQGELTMIGCGAWQIGALYPIATELVKGGAGPRGRPHRGAAISSRAMRIRGAPAVLRVRA